MGIRNTVFSVSRKDAKFRKAADYVHFTKCVLVRKERLRRFLKRAILVGHFGFQPQRRAAL